MRDEPTIGEFRALSDRDPRKPWAAEALEGREPEAAAYVAALERGVEAILRAGAALLEPTNIRTGDQGYRWGARAVRSHILHGLGAVDAGAGRVLAPEILERLGVRAEAEVAERWYVSDDPQYPGWCAAGGAALPLFWLLHRRPGEALGATHAAEHGPARGMIMKDLDAAEPLSWQVHIGVEEGYLVESMPEGTGLFLGVNEPADEEGRRALVARARRMLAAKDPRVVRAPGLEDGIETPAALPDGLDSFVARLLAGIRDDAPLGDLVEHLLREGRNVVDLVGFGLDGEGRLDPSKSLVQIGRPAPGDRIVTRERTPHALFGSGGAIGWFKEWKGTATGSRAASVPTGEQTWAIADNLLGKRPRKGKVTERKLGEALAAVKAAGRWRRLVPADSAPRAAGERIEVAPGVVAQRIHDEGQYSALRGEMRPGARARLVRGGLCSALVVARGALRVCGASGRTAIERLGLEGPWRGTPDHTNEAFVLASEGDLLLESVGREPCIFYDSVRPVRGVRLPALTPR